MTLAFFSAKAQKKSFRLFFRNCVEFYDDWKNPVSKLNIFISS